MHLIRGRRQRGPTGCSWRHAEVSRMAAELDATVAAFRGPAPRQRSLPLLWVDALTQKDREAGRVVNVSAVIATAVNGDGRREIVGSDIGARQWTPPLD